MMETNKQNRVKIPETKLDEQPIGQLAFDLRTMMSLLRPNFATLILSEESKIVEMEAQKDEEISQEMLFALYYAANQLRENLYMEPYTLYTAARLKDACRREIVRRVNKKFNPS